MTRATAEIAERVHCLYGLVMRAQMESMFDDPGADRAGIKRQMNGMRAWAAERAFSEQERALMDCEPGGWSSEESFSVHWRTESMMVLLWALGKLPRIPPYGRRAVPSLYREGLPMGETAATWEETCVLRDEEDLTDEREVAELWHWRCRTRLMQLQGMPAPPGDSYAATVARAMASAREQGLTHESGDDLIVDGVPVGELTNDDFAEAMSSSYERHLALSWLCGQDDWDETTTDT